MIKYGFIEAHEWQNNIEVKMTLNRDGFEEIKDFYKIYRKYVKMRKSLLEKRRVKCYTSKIDVELNVNTLYLTIKGTENIEEFEDFLDYIKSIDYIAFIE